MPLDNLTGKKFGKLTVVSRAENSKSGATRWNCICDCGNTNYIVVHSKNLKSGHTTSCGCNVIEFCKSRLKDLSGMKFGFLDVIERVEKPKNKKGRRTYYKCICRCGYCGDKEVIVEYWNLKSGQTTSCGCKEIKSKKMSMTMKKYNDYDLNSYEYGVGYTSSGEEFYFDKEDYEKIKDYCWYSCKDESIAANLNNENKEKVYLHRYVMGVKDDKSVIVDHIGHNKKDNRKENLRIVDASQNGMNKSILPSNKHGVPGVYFRKDSNKWRAFITAYNKHYSLGDYENFEDAVKARKEAEKKYFGEYSYDASMKIANNIN